MLTCASYNKGTLASAISSLPLVTACYLLTTSPFSLLRSERLDRSQAEDARKKEACAINQSLSALGDIFAALSARSGHVSGRAGWRESPGLIVMPELLNPCRTMARLLSCKSKQFELGFQAFPHGMTSCCLPAVWLTDCRCPTATPS